ncbi:MAG: LysR family transcriptional regulator [Deltaproteobacteria bacterium]|nr:MAG: LysR family transcriptional regulator [Deltaproteobacteria bacterium]
MTPTLRQLEYIVALAETGHFGQAAARCGVSQPALSRQVRDVEELLGVALFERTRPRTLPTEAGQGLVARARGVLADVRELAEAARAHAGLGRAHVRIGVIPTVAPYALPGLLAEARLLLPEATFAVHELQTEVLLDALAGGIVDLALLARPFPAGGFAGTDLVFEPFVLVAPTGHPLARRCAVDREELAGASLILLEDGHCLRDQALEVCTLAGAPPETTVTAASITTLMRMVEGGLGATLLPASALSVELATTRAVRARSFAGDPPGRLLTLQWRGSSPHGAVHRLLADALRAHYLGLNADMPAVHGPCPAIVSAGQA